MVQAFSPWYTSISPYFLVFFFLLPGCHADMSDNSNRHPLVLVIFQTTLSAGSTNVPIPTSWPKPSENRPPNPLRMQKPRCRPGNTSGFGDPWRIEPARTVSGSSRAFWDETITSVSLTQHNTILSRPGGSLTPVVFFLCFGCGCLAQSTRSANKRRRRTMVSRTTKPLFFVS